MGHVNLTLNCRKNQPPFKILPIDVLIRFFLCFITVTMEDITTQKDYPKSSMFSKATTRTFQILGERGGSVVECRTPEREVRGSRPTAAVLCP